LLSRNCANWRMENSKNGCWKLGKSLENAHQHRSRVVYYWNPQISARKWLFCSTLTSIFRYDCNFTHFFLVFAIFSHVTMASIFPSQLSCNNHLALTKYHTAIVCLHSESSFH
jgi:hypothetical protein